MLYVISHTVKKLIHTVCTTTLWYGDISNSYTTQHWKLVFKKSNYNKKNYSVLTYPKCDHKEHIIFLLHIPSHRIYTQYNHFHKVPR